MVQHASHDAPAPEPWNGTVVRSRFFDAISLLLPSGEAFMIGTMSQWLAEAAARLGPNERDEALRFLREEEAHQKVHQRYNDELIARQPGVAPIAERAGNAVQALERFDLRTRLALVAAIEYLTSLLSAEMLQRPHLLLPAPTRQNRVWRWHAREELSHSHIAFEAAASMRPGAWRLGWTYLAATAWLWFDLLRHCAALCRCDRESGVAGARRMRLSVDTGRFLFGSLPSLGRMAAGWFRYFTHMPSSPAHAATAPGGLTAANFPTARHRTLAPSRRFPSKGLP